MPDENPSDIGRTESDEPSTPPPAVPAIDLSKPEEPEPPSPVDGGPLVSAPDAEPVPPPAPVLPADSPPGATAEPPLPPPSAATPPAAGGDDEAEPAPPRGSKGQVWKMALVVVVFLAVVVVAFVLGKKDGGDEDTASSTSTTINVSPIDTSSWATFTDEAAGFSIKHPKDWLKLPTEGAERLVLQAGPESAAYVTVRNIDSETAPEVIQQSLGGVTYVDGGEPANDSINGLPVVREIFETPINEDSPDPGVAVRYFVVTPKKLYQLVFVTRPPEELNRLARMFKGVASSFTSTSDDPAPEPAPTTSPTTG